MTRTRKDAIEVLQSLGWSVEEIVQALGSQTVIYNRLPHQQKVVDWTEMAIGTGAPPKEYKMNDQIQG